MFIENYVFGSERWSRVWMENSMCASSEQENRCNGHNMDGSTGWAKLGCGGIDGSGRLDDGDTVLLV